MGAAAAFDQFEFAVGLISTININDQFPDSV